MREFVRPKPWLAVAVACALGCATSKARIYRPDGPPLAAEIESSDASTLVLRGPTANRFDADEPRRVALGQYQVSAIDHPGNVLALIGLGEAAASGLLFATWTSDFRRNGAADPNWFGGPIGFAFLTGIVTGLAVAAFNGVVWGRSKADARRFEQSRPPLWLVPPAAPGQSETLAPPRPPLGDDDEDPSGKPGKGFHR